MLKNYLTIAWRSLLKRRSVSLINKIIPITILFLATSCTTNNEPLTDKSKIPDQMAQQADSTKSPGSGYKDVNDIKMYYEIHGSGNPLVMIHGGGSTIYTSFGKLLPLMARTHKIIAVELQAHGHSSDRESPESFEQDADDVAELMKQLGIEKADIIGFSNGGCTALQLAIRQPQRVNKLVPISCMFKKDGMQEWFWPFMEKGTFNDMPQVYKDAFLKINPDKEKLLTMFHKDQQRMLGFKDWDAAALKSIQAPALVILGDKDVVRCEHGVEMAGLLPQGRLAILPGGHGDFMGEIMSPDPKSKTPEVTAALIEAFLSEPIPAKEKNH